MTAMEMMKNELVEEAKTTRRLLERVPPERLTWKPHEKSMTLGQLALHVAKIPGDLTAMSQADGFDTTNANFTPPEPESAAQILEAFEESVNTAGHYLDSLDQSKAFSTWKLTNHGPRSVRPSSYRTPTEPDDESLVSSPRSVDSLSPAAQYSLARRVRPNCRRKSFRLSWRGHEPASGRSN